MSMSNPIHILMFPYPAQGHLLPMLDLAHQLAIRGLALTILVTPKNLPSLNSLLSAHPSSIHTLILPFPHYHSLPAGVENVREIGNSGNLAMINALGQLHGPIAQWYKAQPTPPVAILSDFFLGWTLHLANKLHIPRIVFYSSGAFASSVIDDIFQNAKDILTLPEVDFPDLPRSPSFASRHLPAMCRFCGETDPEGKFLKDGMLANMSSWGAVFNTFDAVEGEYLDYVRKKMGHHRVWGVGPLNSACEATKNMGRVKPYNDFVMSWLDGCPDGSVLYVCFGSQKLLTRNQMEALAIGLEKSQARFVWVVKSVTAQQSTDGYESIPDGFVDRVSRRGLVIKGWAPQKLILDHRAVGGFLSHCGWNSMLEGMMTGVVILAWPMEADQFVNARLLVEDMKAAIRVCEGANSVPNSDELAWSISRCMGGEIPQKVRAKELKDETLQTIKRGGSSWGYLEDLVKELAQIQTQVG